MPKTKTSGIEISHVTMIAGAHARPAGDMQPTRPAAAAPAPGGYRWTWARPAGRTAAQRTAAGHTAGSPDTAAGAVSAYGCTWP